jgi:hypothetical protein
MLVTSKRSLAARAWFAEPTMANVVNKPKQTLRIRGIMDVAP